MLKLVQNCFLKKAKNSHELIFFGVVLLSHYNKASFDDGLTYVFILRKRADFSRWRDDFSRESYLTAAELVPILK